MVETMPLVHPKLKNVMSFGPTGYAGQYRNLRFIVTTVDHEGKEWLHASVSRSDKRLPTYEDLKTLKELCIGDHRTALQIFPPKDKHIDIASKNGGPEVLHLWCCLDGDVTPDFGKEGMI